MRGTFLVFLLMLIAVSSLFGQSGQAAMSPTTVVAGNGITVTVTLDKAPTSTTYRRRMYSLVY
jgi:hypothetical protein